ncbi:hypothetical protein C4K00_4043 [Pseudomonas synxantha]|uniref:hypothetical protein n=1 Tax=Pseudomonas synxantha TaxID=47883 RepID=UPI000F57831B|nr:hypothetical protein [Pseudomonas synxantha]AZE74255.1 hypothetical protein C4K00_4043 [Pseudomonas synxantha]
MGIAASELCRYVIKPTLMYLGRHDAAAESLLLGIAASQSELGSALHDRRGHGLYRITEPRHRALWDDYLALDPERASLVRGLASQHAFLTAPQLELTVNLRYATAIAWLLVEQNSPALPTPGDVLAMARIWKEIFHPQGRLRDFTQAWQTCVCPIKQLAY